MTANSVLAIGTPRDARSYLAARLAGIASHRRLRETADEIRRCFAAPTSSTDELKLGTPYFLFSRRVANWTMQIAVMAQPVASQLELYPRGDDACNFSTDDGLIDEKKQSWMKQ